MNKIFNEMIDINLNPFPSLITARLILRRLQLSDADEIFLLRSDDSVNAFIDRQKATSVSDATAFINKIITIQTNGEGLMWAIQFKDDLKLIGTIGIWNIKEDKGEAEIGFELLPLYQGIGIMLEALQSAIQFAFENLKLKTIVANSRGDNLKSISLLEKCGFIKASKANGAYLICKLSSDC
jgi:ribosomal-protein-alanine N-acetyltransferase